MRSTQRRVKGRRDYYAATVKWEWNGSSEPGLLVRWLSPGDWLAVGLSPTDGKVRLYRRKGDGVFEILATGGTTVNLSTSTWYTMKVLVDESSGQRLQVWVDTLDTPRPLRGEECTLRAAPRPGQADRDGDFGDETVLLTDAAYIDADWPLTRPSGKGSQFLRRERANEELDCFAACAAVLKGVLPLPGLRRRLINFEVDQRHRSARSRRRNLPAPVSGETPAQVVRASVVVAFIRAAEDVSVCGHRAAGSARTTGRVKGRSGGYVGVFRGRPGTTTTKFDDFKLVDASGQTEVVLIDDDFASNQVTLTYDNTLDLAALRQGQAGNLTNDGVFQYVYDAWNRLVEVLLKEGTDETTIAAYEYDAQNRRLSKAITNSGAEAIEGDGGNTTVHYYYSSQWQILETRNGSNQATRQWAWGFQYVDEPIFMDVNRAPTHGNDCDPDVEEGGGNNDARYYYQQDRNWNVVAVLESDFPAAGGYAAGVAGRVAERYAYTPYGEFVALRGDSGSGQLGNVLNTSYVGSPFAHQGLGWDAEKPTCQNRHRKRTSSHRLLSPQDNLAPQQSTVHCCKPESTDWLASWCVTLLEITVELHRENEPCTCPDGTQATRLCIAYLTLKEKECHKLARINWVPKDPLPPECVGFECKPTYTIQTQPEYEEKYFLDCGACNCSNHACVAPS